MKACRSLCAVLAFFMVPAFSQQSETAFDALHASEEQRAAALFHLLNTTAAQPHPLDVTYYRLAVRLSAGNGSLSGDVTMKAVVLDQTLTGITMDLSPSMTVDSVFVDGTPAVFTRAQSQFTIAPSSAYTRGAMLTVRIVYHGLPSKTGLGSYTDTFDSAGARWIYTLSEPYGARDWWPCIDHPSEKADSADITITCDAALTAVSNGLLVANTLNADGTRTFSWKHRYPISTYLIAVTIGRFTEYSDYYRYSPTDSMPVVNYVLTTSPNRTANYRANTALTPRMLEVYSSIFGQYPFIREKYGHVEFGWGGGMEHQTLTSLGTGAFTEGTIAHELAHQWFGDMITCRTWGDLWLNEGFAQYFQAVWQERQYGQSVYFSTMQSRASGSSSGAKRAAGTLYVQDTANVNNLFAQNRVYNKGAWVLHMLRHTVGDSLFFAAIRAYANDPAVKYGTAQTADLRRNFERTTGRDLAWFFNEWVFGESYPRYTYSMSTSADSTAYRARVRIQQSTGTSNPVFFTMPIELRFTQAAWETTVTVFNTSADETFGFTLSHRPNFVQLDPQQWILRDATAGPNTFADGSAAPGAYWLSQNFPNPFNPSTVITYSIAEAARVVIRLYDVMGREVQTLVDADAQPGVHTLPLDAHALASGVYLYRMTATHGEHVFSSARKLLLMR